MSAATWVEPGYLLYDRDGRFVAQRLDPRRLELVGDVIPLINNTPRTSEDATRVATGSTTGRIAMLHVDPTLNHVQWVDRTGATRRRLPIAPDLVFAPVLSHDGKRAVLSRLIGRFAFQVLRVDLERGVAATLTDVRDYNVAQCWSPDDRTLAMSSILSGGHQEIRLMPADGSGPPRLVPTSAAQFKAPEAWSPDGRSIVINQIMPGTGRDLFVIDAERGGAPRPVAVAPGTQMFGAISADGIWLAYGSEETGKWQVFVCRFPDGANKLQFTADGGAEPHWTRGDREIVYIGEDRRSFYAIPFEPGREPGPDAARLLFRLPYKVPS